MSKRIERSALRAVVKGWRQDASAPRILLLVGSPGSGKSTFCEGLAASDDPSIDAAHFCRWNDVSSTSPLAVISAIAAQLSRSIPGFGEELLKDSSARSVVNVNIKAGSIDGEVVGAQIEVLDLSGLSLRDAIWTSLTRPLQRLASAERLGRCTILIDGLDEAAEDAANLAGMLAQLSGLPPSVRFIVSSRPDGRVLRTIPEPTRRTFSLDDDYPAEFRREELSAIVLDLLTRPGVDAARASNITSQIVDRAGANFQFAALLATFAADRPDEWDRGEAPQEVGDLFSRYLNILEPDARAWARTYGPILGLLSVAQQPLTEIQIAKYASLQASETRVALDALAPFLRRHRREQDSTFSIYHLSFSDFIKSEAAGVYWRSPEESHRALIKLVGGPETLDWSLADGYLLRYASVHFIGGSWPLQILAQAFGTQLYTEKIARQNLAEVVDDYRLYARLLCNSGATLLLWRVAWAAALAREGSRMGAASLIAAYVKTGHWSTARNLALALDDQSTNYGSERRSALKEIAIELAGLGDLKACIEVLEHLDTDDRRAAASAAAEQLAITKPGEAIELLSSTGCTQASAKTCASIARVPELRNDAIRLAVGSAEHLWAIAIVLWPSDPTAAESLVRYTGWTEVVAGIKHDRVVSDLPAIAVRYLSHSDPVRAADLLPSPRPQMFSLDRPNATVLIAGRLFPYDPERALTLIADLRPYDAVMARAMICAAGGSARAPDLAKITSYEDRYGRAYFDRPSALELADQIDLAALAANADARNLSAWCLNHLLGWLRSREEPDHAFDYRYLAMPLIGRWIGTTSPQQALEFVDWTNATLSLSTGDALKGIVAGIAEVSGCTGALEWLGAHPSHVTSDTLAAATRAIANNGTSDVFSFIDQIARHPQEHLFLRGIAARAMSVDRCKEFQARLLQLPPYGASREYQSLRVTVLCLVDVSLGQTLSEIESLPTHLKEWVQFQTAEADAAREIALTATDKLVSAALLHRLARRSNDVSDLTLAATNCCDSAASGLLIPGVNWIRSEDLFEQIVADAAKLDPQAGVNIAMLDPENEKGLGIAVGTILKKRSNADPVSITTELLTFLPRSAGAGMADVAANWRKTVAIVTAVANHTSRLDDLLAWVDRQDRSLAHLLRCRNSTEDLGSLVAKAREQIHGDGSLSDLMAQRALTEALERMATRNFPKAIEIWRAELKGSLRARSSFVDLARAAATCSDLDRAALACALRDDDLLGRGALDDALRDVAIERARIDWRQGLARLADISDPSVRGLALGALAEARQGAPERTQTELLAILEAAEDLEEEEHRLRVLEQLAYDESAAWDLNSLEVFLLHCIGGSRGRWHELLLPITLRIGEHSPGFLDRIRQEFDIVDEMATVAVL